MMTLMAVKLDLLSGGTYFPPSDRYGRPGFKTLLTKIAEAWRKDKPGMKSQGVKFLTAISQAVQGDGGIFCASSPSLS